MFIYPRASCCQYGAYKPENAGTKYTSPEHLTLSAISCDCVILLNSCILSRNHDNAAPATATEPSNAYVAGALPILYAIVVMRP